MSKTRNPEPQVPPFITDGRGYNYLMPILVETELTQIHGKKPDRALVIQNMTDKSKLAKSWEPDPEVVEGELKTVPFTEISEEITENIGVIINSENQELAGKANEFTETLNKLNIELANYNGLKEESEKAYDQLKSELSGNSQENATKLEAHNNKYKELPTKLKDLEERFQALREKADTVRRSMVLRPD